MLIAFCEQTKEQNRPPNATDQQLMEIVMARHSFFISYSLCVPAPKIWMFKYQCKFIKCMQWIFTDMKRRWWILCRTSLVENLLVQCLFRSCFNFIFLALSLYIHLPISFSFGLHMSKLSYSHLVSLMMQIQRLKLDLET